LSNAGLHLLRQRHAVLAAGGVVDHDRMQAGSIGAVGVVENQRRADLADRRRAKTLGARHLQDGFLIQIVAVEMLVDIAQHRIVLDEGDDGVAGGRGRKTGIDRVAERSGIAEVMPGRHRRSRSPW